MITKNRRDINITNLATVPVYTYIFFPTDFAFGLLMAVDGLLPLHPLLPDLLEAAVQVLVQRVFLNEVPQLDNLLLYADLLLTAALLLLREVALLLYQAV